VRYCAPLATLRAAGKVRWGLMANDSKHSTRDQFLAHWQPVLAGQPREFSLEELAKSDRHSVLRREVAIVSMGNSAEAHSSAMAPDIDDRTGIAVATAVSQRSGARYLGHCPFATDRLDGLAKVWSPVCLSVDECREKTIAYLQMLCSNHGAPKHLWLVSGHGGNGALIPHLKSMRLALGLTTLHYELALRVPPELPHLNTQHAGDLEHSVAKAMGPGCFDEEAFATLQSNLQNHLAETLLAEPALAGMAGYYIAGDQRFDLVRNRYVGVKDAVQHIVTTRSIIANAAWGQRILDFTVESLAADVLSAFGLSQHQEIDSP
jgi:creatinine amidohydrolase/Fe(II)-dependent formamide hydrolase-like protein